MLLFTTTVAHHNKGGSGIMKVYLIQMPALLVGHEAIGNTAQRLH